MRVCAVLAWGLWLTSLKLRLTVPRVLLQALFLIDDDVLDVLHGEVVAEGVEQDVFQLLQGDPLHVELPQHREDTFSLADLYNFLMGLQPLTQNDPRTNCRCSIHSILQKKPYF